MTRKPGFLSRLVRRVRSFWRGEAYEGPGYLISPLDLLGGIKGIEHSWYGLLAAWQQRRVKGQTRPSQITDAQIRDLARLLERYNPYAQGMLTALSAYTLGDKGLQVEVLARPDEAGNADEALQAAAQTYLDEFRDREDWWSRERELYNRCHRDGEGVLRFFAGPTRRSNRRLSYHDRRTSPVRVRFIEPEWIVPPDTTPEWSEGVRQDPRDAETVDALWVQTGATPADGEEVSSDEFYLIRCNADACLKRGLSDFASVAPLIMQALDTLSSMIQAEGFRQGIVFVTEHGDSSPADLDAFIASQTDYSDRASTFSESGRQIPTQATPTVREVHLTGTQKLSAIPDPGSVQGAVQAINTALLSVGVRYHMPLWVISGDASRNNALDLSAEGPFGRFIAGEQAWFSRHVRNIMWRALEVGVDRGVLPAAVLEAVDVSVAAQRPQEQRDPLKETQHNQILHDAGIMGKPTWAAREGLDFEAEQDDLERHGGGQPAATEPPAPATAGPATSGNGTSNGRAFLDQRGGQGVRANSSWTRSG